ncbi:MAG: hypothetical protein R2781_10500 [Flavobacteriaceae bacterium]
MDKKLLIPGYYLFYSRLKRKSELFSLLYVYPLFLFGIIYISKDFLFLNYFITFILGMIIWISSYEIGYLENDVFTIKKEKNPTLRISEDKIQSIEKNFSKIRFFKIGISVLGIGALYFMDKQGFIECNLLFFLIGMLLSRSSFYAHNTLRSRWNIVTYFFLSTTKYLSITVLFLDFKIAYSTFLTVALLFPLPRTLEHAAKVKYGLNTYSKWIGNLDTFRLKYYTVAVLIGLLIYYFSNLPNHSVPLFGALWFFAFRMGIFILLQWGAYKRTNFSSHKWD